MKLSPQEFFDKYSGVAISDSVYSGIPPSIKLAQAALESEWGGSGLTQRANNFFGIKSHGWEGPTYSASTQEYYESSPTIVDALWRVYNSPYASFMDHTSFLEENDRYNNLFDLDPLNYKGWAYGLENAGYATDPDYAEKLINLIEKYNLTKYDRKAEQRKTLKNIVWILFIISLIVTAFSLYKKLR